MKTAARTSDAVSSAGAGAAADTVVNEAGLALTVAGFDATVTAVILAVVAVKRQSALAGNGTSGDVACSVLRRKYLIDYEVCRTNLKGKSGRLKSSI